MLKKLKRYIRQSIRYARFFTRPSLVLKSSLVIKDGVVTHFNFGDDIGIPLIEALCGEKVLLAQLCDLPKVKHLLTIGSIIEYFCSPQSVIWGSGAMYGNQPLNAKPARVCAVRGPKTREYLLSQGIECPAVYGDPALLLPLIYSPKSVKKYRMGIIPHFVDYNLPHVVKFRESHPEVLFIKFQGYSSWQEVIEEINSCEVIVSSSLHGLIVADAYGIPNVRAKFSDGILGGDFKYEDYYRGVGREYVQALDFRMAIDIECAWECLKNYKPISFDAGNLLRAFPCPSKLRLRKIQVRMAEKGLAFARPAVFPASLMFKDACR